MLALALLDVIVSFVGLHEMMAVTFTTPSRRPESDMERPHDHACLFWQTVWP